MGTTVSFIFRKSPLKEDRINKANPNGYVYVRKIENRETTYRSLKLPKFKKEYWDDERQRVRKNKNIDYAKYNVKIEASLRDILEMHGSFRGIDETNDGRSFFKYFKSVLDSDRFKNKHGTRAKYTSVYKKLEGFLSSKKKTDLLFSELDVDLIDNLQYYMLDTGMEVNTVTHYLKVIQSVVRRSMVNRNIRNTYNPFLNFKFAKKQIKKKEALNKDEIKFLMKAKIDNPRLDRVRQMFLLQYLFGGMRVGDLLCLKYRNLVDGKLAYRMLKTNYPIEFNITELHVEILSKALEMNTDINQYYSEKDISYYPIESYPEGRKKQYIKNLETSEKRKSAKSRPSPFPTGSSFVKFLDTPDFVFLEDGDFRPLAYQSSYVPSLVEAYLKSQAYARLVTEERKVLNYIKSKGSIPMDSTSSISDGLFKTKEKLITKYLELVQERILEIRKSFFIDFIKELNERGTDPKTKNCFLFGRLKETDFENHNGDHFSDVTELQYKKINRASIVYNRNLKEVQSTLDFPKKLTTHLPRTSFANIMMRNNLNHRHISRTMGHSSVSITDEYLRTGFDDGIVDDVINQTSSDFD